MALLIMLENIRNALDNDECAISIFLDFQKAFDSVDHDSLFMPILFADDTNLFCTNDKLDIFVNKINVELVKIYTQVRVN